MNILVVDDDAMMVESLRIGLQNRGYQVLAAYNGQQVLDQLFHGGQQVDLVITDYLMPAMTGFDLLVAIREMHSTLPVMIMTGYAETKLVIKAMQHRCDGMIEKPFTLDQLTAEIERIQQHILLNTQSNDPYQLLSRFVHQINTHLLALIVHTKLIRLHLCNSDTLQQQYVAHIQTVLKQISQINTGIVNAGRIQEIQCEPIELDALLNHCLDRLETLFTLQNVHVEKSSSQQELRLAGDRFGLEQVVSNLILIAVEAMDGRPGKKIGITVTPFWQSLSVEITIEGTAYGTPRTRLGKIPKLSPTDKNSKDHIKNDPWMKIIKHIVEKQGGKVLIKSQAKAGAKFCVHFPVMPSE